jgi:porphyrinogen peroxidase
MASPQTGIFALGTASHSYLELDATGDAAALATAVASLREPRTTMGGVNLVAGFRPELWRELRSEETPPDAAGFNADVVGIEGFVMPATQHDAVLWISGSSYDVVFDVARAAIDALRGVAGSARRPRAGRTTTTST